MHAAIGSVIAIGTVKILFFALPYNQQHDPERMRSGSVDVTISITTPEITPRVDKRRATKEAEREIDQWVLGLPTCIPDNEDMKNSIWETRRAQ